MAIPGLYDVPQVMAESSLSEEEILDLGESGSIVFMVVVPEIGACRVPDAALSHFMAGADEYAADEMPEHWSKQPSGPWTIKRDRLRVLADSWEKYLILLDRIQAALEPAQTPVTPAPVVAVGMATNKAGPVDKGWVMKKAALIDKHAQRWTTAKRDFQDASENGLSSAAKAPGHGEWFETAALNWAEQRGKLTSEKQQSPANSVFNLAGTKHTMKG